MTWLGQKPDPEPARPITPAPAVSRPVAPQPIPGVGGEKQDLPKVACIGKSVHIKGELSGNEDLAIDGRVDGKITLNGCSVTIGQTGCVEAEMRAKSVVVGGLVKGNVSAETRVEIAATGTMVGDVRAPRVVLVDGARFKGSIDMDPKAGPSHDEPVYASTARS